MVKQIIRVPGKEHLSEYLDYIQSHFPTGSFVLNKKLTGCGATTMVLKNSWPIILCSPRSELNHCKANAPEFIGRVHEFRPCDDRNTSVFELQERMMEYIRKTDLGNPFNGYAPKIIVTYDSFKHVVQRLAEEGILDQFHIVVDEFQTLFTDAAFKGDVEMEFLYNLGFTDQVMYLSATPFMENYLYQLPQFANLPYVELEWPKEAYHTANIQKKPYYRQSIRRTAARIINRFKIEHYFEKKMLHGRELDATEAVFFLNDIGQIIAIIKDNDLTPENTNIICARTEENAVRLSRITDADGNRLGFTIGHAPQYGQQHKPYTFVTRTSFEGVDFYSPCAYTYIFSDINLQHLGIDIWIDVPQIMGRQRREDNPFRMDATFFYKVLASSTTMSDAEFQSNVTAKIAVTNEWIDTYNNSSAQLQNNMANKLRKAQKIDQCADDYVVVIDDKVSGARVVGFNELAMYNEIRAWDIRNSQYLDDCQVMTFVDDTTKTIADDPVVRAFLQNYGGTFEQCIKKYCDTIDAHPDCKEKLEYLPQIPIEIKNYYNVLGPEKIRSNSYIEARLKRLVNTSNKQETLKDATMDAFIPGSFYPLKQVKAILADIYRMLEIEKTAKASDLQNMEWLNVQPAQMRIDGRKENGYKIL